MTIEALLPVVLTVDEVSRVMAHLNADTGGPASRDDTTFTNHSCKRQSSRLFDRLD